MNIVSTTVVDGIAIVTIDLPPVNALSVNVRLGLVAALRQTEADKSVRAVVLCCAGRTFIAGADVREFGNPAQQPHLPDVILQLEAARKPWIAAIHGTALGGGLEVALGCRYRVADKDARLGLPEVHLGLIPGAGGTVRLPRLVGPDVALDMISGGKPVLAQAALTSGLLDQVITGDLVQGAVAFALEILARPKRSAILDLAISAPKDRKDWAAKKTKIGQRARGQKSPLAAIQALENALSCTPAEALKKERDLFSALKQSPQSAALRQVFFAERAVGKIAAIKDVPPRPFDRIGVIGGGTMGAGIAAACLLAGLTVTLVEQDQNGADMGAKRVQSILADSRQRGLIDDAKLVAITAEFTASTSYAELSNANLVIEAVFEDMTDKKDVFRRLDDVTPANAVLATNTSYLDVGEIAQELRNPSRLLGLHFFSPAHVMKLLEIVRPPDVENVVLATGFALAKKLGKIAVPAGVCDGFIGNRMMSAYRREADYMIEDGAWPQDVDRAMVEFGFSMGIFAMQDLAGLDIGWAARKRRAPTRDRSERYVSIADRLCELGRLGRKTGAGWYDYSDDPNGRVDPRVDRIIEAEATRRGIVRQKISTDQLMHRILSTMQAEGQAILTEGIADGPDAIDVVMINGYGFPRWRGGPMYMLG